MQKIGILAVDIETGGPQFTKHPLISIGYCLGDIHGNVIEKKRINFEFSVQTFDSKTYSEFWADHLDKLSKFKENNKTVLEGIKEFINDVDKFDDSYSLRIISDNPSFDIGFINYYLSEHLNRRGLNYKHDNQYRPIYDIDSYNRGAIGLNFRDIWTPDAVVLKTLKLKIDAIHDHMPENDAEYIYKIHTSVVNKVSRQ